jgi:hypothetical protein
LPDDWLPSGAIRKALRASARSDAGASLTAYASLLGLPASGRGGYPGGMSGLDGTAAGQDNSRSARGSQKAAGLHEKRNKRSVWTIATQPFSEAHFATFPLALVEPCILAGCPAGGMVLDPFGGAGTTGLVADRL